MASATVYSRGTYAYLFAGSVSKKYRGRGLWKNLIAIRQAVTSSLGVRYWLYSTQNDILKDKGDYGVYNNIIEKRY